MNEEINEVNNVEVNSSINEEVPENASTETQAEELEFSKIRETIDKHFSTIEGLIRYSKAKDANVLTLSKQLQEYREGFTKSIYKRIALELIAFREECRKSQKNLADEVSSKDTAFKYLGFLCDDFYDLMQNIGLSQKGDEYFYNGKPLTGEALTPVEIKEPEDIQEVQRSGETVNDFNGLVEYLKSAENVIVATLKNNSILDSLMADYIKLASVYEQGLYQVVLYPTMRKIISLYQMLTQKANQDKESITDEDANVIYASSLELLVDSLEEILFLLDVSIDKNIQDTYDAKTNRILKTIFTDDTSLNGKIASRYTDCYVMDERVIYPAKVDVYRTKN